MTTPRTPRQPRPLRDVDAVLRELERGASDSFRADMSARYGIVTHMRVLGTPMASTAARTAPEGSGSSTRDSDDRTSRWIGKDEVEGTGSGL